MPGKFKLFLYSALLLLSPSMLFAEDIYYVQSLKAKIMAEPSFKAKIVAEAAKGEKLQSSVKQGTWVKVTFNKQSGYVSSLLLTKYPPLERQTVIKGSESDINQNVRRRASTYTSAAAARGLAQDDRRRLSRDEKTDYASLEKVEAFTVSANEVSRFMEGTK